MALAKTEADAHYAAVYAVYMEIIPPFLRPDGAAAEFLKSRPAGFNGDAKEYCYYLDLGERHAQTFAIFSFRRTAAVWRLRHFVSQLVVPNAGVRQACALTLPAAILTASELWEDANGAPGQPLGQAIIQ